MYFCLDPDLVKINLNRHGFKTDIRFRGGDNFIFSLTLLIVEYVTL